MKNEVKNLNDILLDSWNNFLDTLPSLVIAIIIGVLGVIAIKYISKLAHTLIEKKSKDSLVSDFLVNIISIVLMLFLVVICLSIVGWGNITNKILAGAGITTFVIGFALKDIGENFLAGILMAFRRPFRVGDTIEITGIKGKVQKMSMRETSIKTLDGIDVYIPNANVIKNPLKNYTIDSLLRNEFDLSLGYQEDIDQIIPVLENTLKEFIYVLSNPAPQVFIQDLSSGSVNIKVQYWFRITEVKPSAAALRSSIILRCFRVIKDHGYSLPNGVVEVKVVEATTEEEKEKQG